MDKEIVQLRKAAEEIAYAAGELICSLAREKRTITFKGTRDMATQVDAAAEALITRQIQTRFPHHSILAEESGLSLHAESPYQWIVDPLDGTTNFVHGFPVFAVSIGVAFEGKLCAGVVYDPNLDELYSAGLSQGTTLNGKKISVSNTSELSHSLVATGFPYTNDNYFQLNMELWSQIYGKTQGLRRAGAAALDLAWLAAGRLDGFWEFRLNPWDMAAGVLLVQEAGGMVTSPSGDDFKLSDGHLVAANPDLHPQLLKELHPHRERF